MIRAGVTHAAAMAAIHGASFSPAEAWGRDVFALQLALPGVIGLLDPAGGVVLARVAADEAEILTLAVQPDLRRQRVGHRLLAAALAAVRAAGARTMFLEVSETNRPARGLYESLGFAQVGRRRRYYPDGSDALVLRRTVICAATAGG